MSPALRTPRVPTSTVTVPMPSLGMRRPARWVTAASTSICHIGARVDPDLTSLVASAADGDRPAFAMLYDALAPTVYGVARRVLRDPSQAEEVAQEVFVEIWRLAARFDPA